MLKKFLLFLFFFLFFFISYPLRFTYAQDNEWIITNFHSDIAIEKTGIVVISEYVDVDFGTLRKHGIYRDIPYVYEKQNGEKYYTEITVKDVLQDRSKSTYKVYNNGSYVRIQIGNADKTISGKHRYTITYSVKGVLRNFGTYDELYWDVTGDQWGVVMNSVSAKVTLPSAVSFLDKMACYKGPAGSSMKCTAVKTTDHTVNFSTGLLGSMEGMTIAVSYPSSVIPILTITKPKTLSEKLLEPFSIATFFIILVGGVVWVLTLWYRKGRDIRLPGTHETVIVEFTPPEKLRPAELGILMDERADTLDVTATIIDLTSRGYLTITEIAKKWLFGSIDYELTRTEKVDTDLVSYEKMLLDRIFGSAKKKKVSALKNDFYDDLAKIKDTMYEHIMQKGIFVTHPQKTRTNYALLVFLLLGIAISFTVFGAVNEFAFLCISGIALIPVSIVMIILSQFMSRKTAKGRELSRRVKGYREFINTAEKYRQQFFEKKNLFQEVLPYAIVFGLTGKFAEAMKEIGLKNPHINGYYGVHAFNAHTFTNTVSSFSNSFSSAAASAPSSSGSGGGGSSGGGFGGGGGGSW